MSPTAPRRTPLPQPRRESWSAALAPSQVRAAEARAVLSRQRSALDWLRALATSRVSPPSGRRRRDDRRL